MIFLISQRALICYTLLMRKETGGYFLKEYGSWSVLSIAYAVGLAVSRTALTWKVVPLFLALGLLINSKQAFMKWMRRKDDRTALLIFLSHIVVSTVLLLAIFKGDIPRLLPLLIFPAAYLLSNRLAGEHNLMTEVFGFILISLAAVLSKFALTGGMDVRLFVAVAVYFSAGVFKVKALLRKRVQDRILTAVYVLFAVYAYRAFHISLLILLPFIDNIVVAATLYSVKLKTTGWIEVGKSILFLALMAAFY